MTALVQREPQAEIVRPADPMVTMIERVLRDDSVSVERLERLLEMQRSREKDFAEQAFHEALARAKANFSTIRQNREVDFTSAKGRTNYRHEDLDEIERAVKGPLAAEGITYTWKTEQQQGGAVRVTCILRKGVHKEENSLEAGKDDSAGKNHIQAIGSAVTFLQRYTLKASLGLAVSHDDDGKSAGQGDTGTITEDQFRALTTLMEQAGGDERKFLGFFKIEHLGDLPLARFGEADAMLRQKIAKKVGA